MNIYSYVQIMLCIYRYGIWKCMVVVLNVKLCFQNEGGYDDGCFPEPCIHLVKHVFGLIWPTFSFLSSLVP
ncbi:hypothetical protein LOK49_LG08G00558 [Camellia lanceoleosa]|uniref:Uncharacterized protein n=1 Tax=Camellia lanceoleosa TaxID=1840588 RepID=A0ACC0GMK4_9ERIC|nr:hypothetical protein LOK49_LG08G00558 [Camellia lanceoleosa]